MPLLPGLASNKRSRNLGTATQPIPVPIDGTIEQAGEAVLKPPGGILPARRAVPLDLGDGQAAAIIDGAAAVVPHAGAVLLKVGPVVLLAVRRGR